MTMTVVQERLTKLVAALMNLPVETIDLNSSLYAQGGKSLLGVQLLNDIKHEFGVTITPEEASPSQTLGDLASLVSRKLAESPGA